MTKGVADTNFSMQQRFTIKGGAQIGWVNASWPLARPSATCDRLAITARVLGNYYFTPQQVSAVERYALNPFLAWGVRIRHQVPDYPRRIIFWCLCEPKVILQGIRDAGFAPKGSPSSDARGGGIPVRWSAIIGAIAVWTFCSFCPLSANGVVCHLRGGACLFLSTWCWRLFSLP